MDPDVLYTRVALIAVGFFKAVKRIKSYKESGLFKATDIEYFRDPQNNREYCVLDVYSEHLPTEDIIHYLMAKIFGNGPNRKPFTRDDIASLQVNFQMEVTTARFCVFPGDVINKTLDTVIHDVPESVTDLSVLAFIAHTCFRVAKSALTLNHNRAFTDAVIKRKTLSIAYVAIQFSFEISNNLQRQDFYAQSYNNSHELYYLDNSDVTRILKYVIDVLENDLGFTDTRTAIQNRPAPAA